MSAPYIGNNDFRGYLAYLGQQGDTNASAALNYVGNDGGINRNSVNSFYDSPTLDRTADLNAAPGYVSSAYTNFQNLQNRPDSSGVLGSNTTATTGTVSPQQLQQYDQSIGNIQSAIDRTGGQLDVGNRNIDTGYNSSLNTLNQQKATGERNYNQNKVQTGQNFVQAKNQIGTQAGNSLNSLMRLIGSRGAGGSVNDVASQAVARDATLKRTGAGQTFGANNQALDTNFNDYLGNFNNSVADLGRQRDNNKSGLQAQINQTKASLLQNLATLTGQRSQAAGGNPVGAAQPYLDQANGLLSQADQLGAQAPVYQTPQLAYNAPQLSNYTVNPNGAPIQSGANPSLQDSVTPFLNLLMNKRNQPNLSAI